MGNFLQRLNLQVAMAVLITPLIAGCFTDYDKPWVIEANGATIEFPTHGRWWGKNIRNNINGRLTKEQTETLASAMPVITDAVLFTLFENWFDRLKDKFSGAEATFFYEYVIEHSITDRDYGLPTISDWNVTPPRIEFTYNESMLNDMDDGYGGEEKYYHVKIRYSFVANDQGEWLFAKNEFIGFAPGDG